MPNAVLSDAFFDRIMTPILLPCYGCGQPTRERDVFEQPRHASHPRTFGHTTYPLHEAPMALDLTGWDAPPLSLQNTVDRTEERAVVRKPEDAYLGYGAPQYLVERIGDQRQTVTPLADMTPEQLRLKIDMGGLQKRLMNMPDHTMAWLIQHFPPYDPAHSIYRAQDDPRWNDPTAQAPDTSAITRPRYFYDGAYHDTPQAPLTPPAAPVSPDVAPWVPRPAEPIVAPAAGGSEPLPSTDEEGEWIRREAQVMGFRTSVAAVDAAVKAYGKKKSKPVLRAFALVREQLAEKFKTP